MGGPAEILTLRCVVDPYPNFQVDLTDPTGFIIGWGDGQSDTYTGVGDVTASHEYASTGTYYVTLQGIVGRFSVAPWGGYVKEIIGIIDPVMGASLQSLNWSFRATAITSIPAGLFQNCVNVVDCGSVFSSCFSLTSIPSGLFDSCINVTNFSGAFYDCRALTSIPAGLFSLHGLVEDFGGLFQLCTALTGVPADIFGVKGYCTDFEFVFAGCTALQSVPPTLFDGVSAGSISFYGLFYECTGISLFPTGLFSGCLANVGNLQSCFHGCSNMAGAADSYWNRVPVIFPHFFTFYNCTGLSNYSSIPSDWK